MPSEVDPSWLEASLEVTAEFAEAVAEVMVRFAPNGVVIENPAPLTNEETKPGAEVLLRVFCYLPVGEDIEDTRQKLEEGIWHLGQIQPIPAPKFKIIHEANWMEGWKEHFQPIPIGSRLAVLPPWADNPYPERLAILIDPGMAFGTGAHPSTQICLELLENHISPGISMLDIGCGSGILSIAGIKLGASEAFGVDIDPKAVQAAEENSAINQLGDQVKFDLGSVETLLKQESSIAQTPLITANMIAPILQRLFDEGLDKLIPEGGTLILSGILEEEENKIIQTIQAKGLEITERKIISDWVGLALRKN